MRGLSQKTDLESISGIDLLDPVQNGRGQVGGGRCGGRGACVRLGALCKGGGRSPTADLAAAPAEVMLVHADAHGFKAACGLRLRVDEDQGLAAHNGTRDERAFGDPCGEKKLYLPPMELVHARPELLEGDRRMVSIPGAVDDQVDRGFPERFSQHVDRGDHVRARGGLVVADQDDIVRPCEKPDDPGGDAGSQIRDDDIRAFLKACERCHEAVDISVGHEGEPRAAGAAGHELDTRWPSLDDSGKAHVPGEDVADIVLWFDAEEQVGIGEPEVRIDQGDLESLAREQDREVCGNDAFARAALAAGNADDLAFCRGWRLGFKRGGALPWHAA